MHKAKSWLHTQGHIATAGRGRPPKKSSKDGREISSILQEAVESGVKFSDWPKGKVEVTKSEATAEKPAETKVKVIRDAAPSNTVAELAPYRYTEDEFKAVEKGTKKERSLRSACNNRGCGVSLVVCYCPKPMIVKEDGTGSVEVTIIRK